MKHLTTIDVWVVEQGGTTFTVRRQEMWQDGEQQWWVFVDEDGVRRDVQGEKFHEVVRLVQEELMRR